MYYISCHGVTVGGMMSSHTVTDVYTAQRNINTYQDKLVQLFTIAQRNVALSLLEFYTSDLPP